jgi:hypothetical protein
MISPAARRLACPARRPFRRSRISAAVAGLVTLLAGFLPTQHSLAAGSCTDTSGEIAVDRPDVTNSSLVVPEGSLQVENGLNLTDQSAAKVIDGTNTRVRLGVGGCTEIVVDLPDYSTAISGAAPSGFSNVTPAIKHQLGPLPGNFDLSATLGVGLPTGTPAVAGQGLQPYLQFPWSRDVSEGWQLSGMFTTFWYPSDAGRHAAFQPTFVVEREVTAHADLFVEYVGEYPSHGGPEQQINIGGASRITRLQQVDFHLAVGLNPQAPHYELGVGYSIRWDHLIR